ATVQESHRDFVACKVHCCDCCYAVFDLTLIESVYVNYHFNASLSRDERRPIVRRAEKADRKYYQIKQKLQKMYIDEGRPAEEVFHRLAQERVRCPLLNDQDLCDLYLWRPITCRVYGIPTSFGGTAHICEQCGFKQGVGYPTVNMDKMNDRLFELSEALVKEIGATRSKIHMGLVPVSTAVTTDYDEKYFLV
ncbi:MAG: YkgJ family cysteine cluster protein, partial [Deltaproteobacteria bacterium]